MDLEERNAGQISTAEKAEFLQLIGQGLDRAEAARKLGYVGRHFRALCSPQSPFYDEEFARSYGESIGSLEHAQHRLERLRSEAYRRALTDSDRLLEKLLMVYDPDWETLRTHRQDINVNIHAFVQQHFKQLPTDRLEQILSWIEETDHNTIEGVARELPLAVEEAA
jgi:hypothetical protein